MMFTIHEITRRSPKSLAGISCLFRVYSWMVPRSFIISCLLAGLLSAQVVHPQTPQPTPTPLPPTLGLDQGYLEFDTPDFKLKLVKASQTIAALQPKGADGFDFTQTDRLERRAANGYHHLGDLTLRLRTGNTGPWQKYDTADARKAVQSLPPSGHRMAIADLAATLPADIPVQIWRSWIEAEDGLILRFDIKN